MSRKGKVYNFTEFAGIIEETDEGKYLFKYDEAYLNSDKPYPISLTLPLRKEIYESKNLFPFFDGLIPEGWLLSLSVKHWKLNPRDRMGLLLSICEDCIGAVKVIPYAK
ncbi:HipA N-terminal domain-containing protein [Pigmentibacter sp. JX0631]|uniref:HipA N-terminal domain-containing protein n=1 Tax=Pigmentibacter sp. JX0631 TaxID=2976982 RepID=UPI002468FBC0|nr:HipA N-terminal domain-containing protein [Pigmentibacter sp. JX0631]WGL60042.1 HipA N-terminal domain-containing protein [Pigmentibacter sp. JX0631]